MNPKFVYIDASAMPKMTPEILARLQARDDEMIEVPEYALAKMEEIADEFAEPPLRLPPQVPTPPLE